MLSKESRWARGETGIGTVDAASSSLASGTTATGVRGRMSLIDYLDSFRTKVGGVFHPKLEALDSVYSLLFLRSEPLD